MLHGKQENSSAGVESDPTRFLPHLSPQRKIKVALIPAQSSFRPQASDPGSTDDLHDVSSHRQCDAPARRSDGVDGVSIGVHRDQSARAAIALSHRQLAHRSDAGVALTGARGARRRFAHSVRRSGRRRRRCRSVCGDRRDCRQRATATAATDRCWLCERAAAAAGTKCRLFHDFRLVAVPHTAAGAAAIMGTTRTAAITGTASNAADIGTASSSVGATFATASSAATATSATTTTDDVSKSVSITATTARSPHCDV